LALARRVWAWVVARQPWSVLGPLLAVQWLALLVFALTVRHNGWLYYQGGDQSYYWTGAHLLSSWTLPVTAVGYAWSYLLTPLALIWGANVLSGLPAVVVLNALVLVPLALLCVYGIATRIAGRVFGYWAAALWILIPYLAIPLFDQRYHQKYVEIALPQQLGLTVLGDFPSMVCLLVTAYMLVRALDSGDWRDTVLAGIAGAFAIGIKPSNTLFFGAAVLCLLIARRWTQTGAFLAAMIPGLIVLALWKQRGLGQLPAFSSYGGEHGHVAAAGVVLPLGSLTTPFHKYISLDWGQLQSNLDGLREFFWAVRPLEFVPFAGLLAIGRRSWPKAALVFFWFMTFLLIKGTDEKANVEDASFFRLLMPSFPAFLLLLAAIPLLVPAFRLTRRLITEAPPVTRRPGYRALGATAAVLVALPLIVVAGASPQSTPVAVTYPREDVYVPVVRSFDLKVHGSGRHRRISWKAPYSGSTGVYYTLFKAPVVAPDPTSGNGERKTVRGIACRDRENGASLDCLLFMKRLTNQRETTYVDRLKKGRWTYRVGLTANWLDDPTLGDLMLLSPPVTVTGG
jgi:Dolichyl-phosphate-mannose-protein mannosyltransferase